MCVNSTYLGIILKIIIYNPPATKCYLLQGNQRNKTAFNSTLLKMPNANNRTQRNHIVQKKDILHCNLQYMIKVKETVKSKRAILCLFVFVIYHHKIGN